MTINCINDDKLYKNQIKLTIKKSPTGREGNTKVPSSPDRT